MNIEPHHRCPGCCCFRSIHPFIRESKRNDLGRIRTQYASSSLSALHTIEILSIVELSLKLARDINQHTIARLCGAATILNLNINFK